MGLFGLIIIFIGNLVRLQLTNFTLVNDGRRMGKKALILLHVILEKA